MGNMPPVPSNSDSILANMPIPLLLVDAQNNVVFINDACENFLGRSKRHIENSDISDILFFHDKRLNDALADGDVDVSAHDMQMKLRSGNHFVDITITRQAYGDAKTNDKAKGKADNLGRLITLTPHPKTRNHLNDSNDEGVQQSMGAPAILSHEIKNPLAGIRGGAQLLARMVGDDQKQLTDLIINEVDRIARLLDQMQNLGGNTSGEIKPENIHLIIERAIRSVKAANAQMPNLNINYDPSLPDVMIEADAMVQIIINLLQNAIDAMCDTDHPNIGISTRYVMGGKLREASSNDANGRTIKLPVELTISDNGPGIPAHIAKELFSPFVTTKREGQGLGLAIVRKLIRQMNGRILTQRDEANGKTSFKIYLPITEMEKVG